MTADFERFCALVAADDALAQTLWLESRPAEFVELVVDLAAIRALRVDANDVRRAMEGGRSRWMARSNG